jgi:ubiquinol-cytochrome c reductase cytochrome c subunit
VRALLLSAALLLACNHPAGGKPPPDLSPAHEVAQREQATQTMQQNCQMCHSLDLVRAQRLGKGGWEKEVKKMIGWGAPVPPESVASLVDLLTAELGPDVPLTAAEEVDPASVPAMVVPDREGRPGDAKHGATVYQTACASCHGADGLGGPVGPAIAQRPVVWRSADFEEVVRTGRQRMPSVPLDQASLLDTLAFLRAQR